MIGSDELPGDQYPHPRLWGAFPSVIGHYGRDFWLFWLEEAVARMTGNTSKTFGLTDRGNIREGMCADIVVFDPDTIVDQARFDDPIKAATGIESVLSMVNSYTKITARLVSGPECSWHVRPDQFFA